MNSSGTPSLRGAVATKQSIHPRLPADGLLRGALHRARIRATRWLAMTEEIVVHAPSIPPRRGARLSIHQPAIERRQELFIDDVGGMRPLLEFEILRELVERPLEARRVDAADAVALDLAGEDVVADDGAQSLE